MRGDSLLHAVTFDGNTAADLGGGLALDGVATVTLEACVFSGNEVVAGGGGALGTLDLAAPLLVTGSTFTGNSADDGSAVFVDEVGAPLVVTRTTFEGNLATGAGTGGAISLLSVTAPVIVHESSVLGNDDGGIVIDEIVSGGLTVDSSTFADNVGSVSLGASLTVGIVAPGATVDVVNSTFRESVAEASPGVAIFLVLSAGDVTVRHSTLQSYIGVVALAIIDPNASPGPVPGTIFIENSILSRAVVLPDDDLPNAYTVSGIFDVSHNVFTGPRSYTFVDPVDGPTTIDFYHDLGGNQFRVDPLLGPLQHNGGPTMTMMPLPGSPAIDAGTPGAVVPAFDQRGDGFPRVLAGRVDVGAVETPPTLPATGQAIPPWIPIAGGVLLVGGLIAVVATALRRRDRRKPPTD